jgi:hypothetical protein
MANGGFDLSTPLAQLAWDMATRANTAVERAAEADPTIRKRLSEQLGRYGGSLSDVEQSFDEYYKPGMDAYVAQLGAMRDYAIGLPELMVKAAKEGTKVSGGGSLGAAPVTKQWTVEELRDIIGIVPATAMPSQSLEERVKITPHGMGWRPPGWRPPAGKLTATPLSNQTSRASGSNFGIKTQ